ncbi:MAG: hypothetical protein AB3N14_13755 [Flavobacteriaceae bacterium]
MKLIVLSDLEYLRETSVATPDPGLIPSLSSGIGLEGSFTKKTSHASHVSFFTSQIHESKLPEIAQ